MVKRLIHNPSWREVRADCLLSGLLIDRYLANFLTQPRSICPRMVVWVLLYQLMISNSRSQPFIQAYIIEGVLFLMALGCFKLAM